MIEFDHDAPPGTLLPSADEFVFAAETGAAVGFAEIQVSGRQRSPAALLLQELGLSGRTESERRRRSKLVSAALRHVRVAEHLISRARRYLPADWGTQHPILDRWTVQSRYEPTGTFDLSQASDMTRAARMVVDRVVASLWADGALDQGALR